MRINHDSSVVRICSQFKTESGRVFSLTRDARAMETFVSPNLLYPPKPIRTLSTTTDTGLLFRKKLLYLTNLNINTHKALSLNPSLRSTSLSTLISIKTSLSSLGLHHSAVGRILDMYPSLLTTDPNFTIYPVFDFLVNEVKIPFDHFPKSVSRCPRLLISSVSDQLRPTHEFLKSIGFVGRNSIDSKTCLLLVYGVESNLMVKIRFLEGLGFRFSQVKRMVVRSPGLLTLSVEKNLLQKVEYFLKEMNGDLKELLEFPQYFSFSLDRRIKLRHRKLVEFGLTMPLPMMLKASDGEFNVRVTELRLRRVEDG